MRLAFHLLIFLAALGYAYIAIFGLAWSNRGGGIGPGFFPTIIGVGLVILAGWTLVADRTKEEEGEGETHVFTVGVLIAMSIVFVATLNILGGILAMVLFIAMTLTFLNRGRHLTNAALSIAIPAAVYVLFTVWLNANMPRGVLGLPI